MTREVKVHLLRSGDDIAQVIEELMKDRLEDQTREMISNMRFLAIMSFVTTNYEAFNAHVKNVVEPAYEKGLEWADKQIRKEEDGIPKGMKPEQIEEAIRQSKEDFHTKMVPTILVKPDAHIKYDEELDAISKGLPHDQHKHSKGPTIGRDE